MKHGVKWWRDRVQMITDDSGADSVTVELFVHPRTGERVICAGCLGCGETAELKGALQDLTAWIDAHLPHIKRAIGA